MHQLDTEVSSSDICCRVREISITYSECVFVALGIQQVKRMRRILLLSMAYLTVPYLCTLSHEQYDYRETIIKHKMCSNFLYNICKQHFLF
jgi:hypothetical protein